MRNWLIISLLMWALAPPFATAQQIVAAEYFFDSDPGIGSGTAITVTPDSLVDIAEIISTSAVGYGLHAIHVRFQDDAGYWTRAHKRFFNVFDPTFTSNPAYHFITEAELSIDGGAPTVVYLVDGENVSLSEIVSSTGLESGFHLLKVIYRDEVGNVSGSPGKYFYCFRPFAGTIDHHDIVEAEILIDGEPVETYDLADQPFVMLDELISSYGILVGNHTLSVRYLDERGILSGAEGQNIFAFREVPSPLQMKTLTAAEYYINVDPGVGSGIPLLPVDGVWDEDTEILSSPVSGIPMGRHLVGLRFQDSDGIWSPAMEDTFYVGPVVTVRISGNDAILNWITGSDATLFHVFHDTLSTGSFTELGTTPDTTYTHSNILDTENEGFYYITQESNGTVSTFRRPDLRPENERNQQ